MKLKHAKIWNTILLLVLRNWLCFGTQTGITISLIMKWLQINCFMSVFHEKKVHVSRMCMQYGVVRFHEEGWLQTLDDIKLLCGTMLDTLQTDARATIHYVGHVNSRQLAINLMFRPYLVNVGVSQVVSLSFHGEQFVPLFSG